MAQLFGFAQFEFAGPVALADGRYLARGAGGEESVLVVETLGAPAGVAKRRRRARVGDERSTPPTLPLSRITAVRAHSPFDSEHDAARWLERAEGDEGEADAIVSAGSRLLNRALHAHATAAADPHGSGLDPEHAVAIRIGYGSGADVAAGRFTAARELDPRPERTSRRRRRAEELSPQERTAAVLGGRETLDACETLLLRARADLDADREREAALQLRVGLEALLAELAGALRDPGHDRDMGSLRERRGEVGKAAEAALGGELGEADLKNVEELLQICERVLRRRRVMRG